MRTGANPFTDPAEIQGPLYAAADYLATSPKYDLPPALAGSPDGRLAAVERELSAGHVPDARITVPQARRLITSADGPAAFYKDANPRNFLITPDGTPVTIDFDDLTLAPFGYDLAKLIVTLTMAHGPIPGAAITEALSAYNLAANGHCPLLVPVTWDELR